MYFLWTFLTQERFSYIFLHRLFQNAQNLTINIIKAAYVLPVTPAAMFQRGRARSCWCSHHFFWNTRNQKDSGLLSADGKRSAGLGVEGESGVGRGGVGWGVLFFYWIVRFIGSPQTEKRWMVPIGRRCARAPPLSRASTHFSRAGVPGRRPWVSRRKALTLTLTLFLSPSLSWMLSSFQRQPSELI